MDILFTNVPDLYLEENRDAINRTIRQSTSSSRANSLDSS